MPDAIVTSATTPTLGEDASKDTFGQRDQRPKLRPPGWGADLALEDRPAVPKERMPARLEGVHWDVPEQQTQHVEVLCSVERPGITPIFGSSLPPSGASGRVRSYAFTFSENDVRHWLLLLAADRINVGEGLMSDVMSGHIPNVFAEMGGKAEFRHNPRGAARKVGVLVGVLALAYAWRRRRRR